MREERIVIIEAKNKWYNIKLKELWEYRDLIFLFVKRNYSTRYKQTILEPAWLVISPLFTVLMYTIVFGGIAGLSTDGIPKPVFYLSGNILWTFFSSNVSANSNTFLQNAGIFGKIYFPRLVTPISVVFTNMLDLLVQLGLLFFLMFYYMLNGIHFMVNRAILFIPILFLELGLLGMGVGILISACTTKYRDLTVLVGFGLNIWLYASPVIYSITFIPETLRNIFMLNPVTPIILTFKYALFGIGSIPILFLIISFLVTITILFLGIIVFNKVERNFLDTI